MRYIGLETIFAHGNNTCWGGKVAIPYKMIWFRIDSDLCHRVHKQSLPPRIKSHHKIFLYIFYVISYLNISRMKNNTNWRRRFVGDDGDRWMIARIFAWCFLSAKNLFTKFDFSVKHCMAIMTCRRVCVIDAK